MSHNHHYAQYYQAVRCVNAGLTVNVKAILIKINGMLRGTPLAYATRRNGSRIFTQVNRNGAIRKRVGMRVVRVSMSYGRWMPKTREAHPARS